MQPQNPFKRGIHTYGACGAIDKAFNYYRNGKSYFAIIEICFRHGKSDMGPRTAVPHFLGEFPDSEALVVTHSSSLCQKFSRSARDLIQSEKFRELYPNIQLSKKSSSVGVWEIAGKYGKAQYSGIHGGTAGMGGGLILVDDYFGKREDAESSVMRDKVWDSFTDNIVTRRADPSIILILVTPWHVDDIVGRIKKRMKTDENFPRFELFSYPAKSEKYKTGYLFPERYSPEWYEAQKILLGKYGYRSLMQCDPTTKGGNAFNMGRVQWLVEPIAPFPASTRWYRGWDLASSSKQTEKDDPDYTVGALCGIYQKPTAFKDISVPVIIVKDIVRGRWESLQRQEIMRATAMNDGPGVIQRVESVAGYKDAYTDMLTTMRGICDVEQVVTSTDKITKSLKIAPAFDAGNVYIKRDRERKTIAGMPDHEFLEEMEGFPNGAHDDIADAIMIACGNPNEVSGVINIRG